MKSQYVIPPPDIPEFLYRSNVTAWENLVVWAKKEYRARLRYCAKNSYKKEWLWLMENSSPIHILAQLSDYRKMISVITKGTWRDLEKADRIFFTRAYELRDLLFR